MSRSRIDLIRPVRGMSLPKREPDTLVVLALTLERAMTEAANAFGPLRWDKDRVFAKNGLEVRPLGMVRGPWFAQDLGRPKQIRVDLETEIDDNTVRRLLYGDGEIIMRKEGGFLVCERWDL